MLISISEIVHVQMILREKKGLFTRKSTTKFSHYFNSPIFYIVVLSALGNGSVGKRNVVIVVSSSIRALKIETKKIILENYATRVTKLFIFWLIFSPKEQLIGKKKIKD